MSKRLINFYLIIIGGLFFWTLALKLVSPTVTLKDSGELITTAYTLGIAHPPGYPLYSLTAKLFALLPLGEIAIRLNLFSAFMGVLSLVLGFLLIKKLGGRTAGALFAIGLLGSSLIYFDTFLITEVYTFEMVLMLLILYLLLYRNSLLSLTSISLLVALHPKNVIYCLPFFICWLTDYYKIGLKRLLLALTIALIPISVYLYLPMRAVNKPTLNWNSPTNITRAILHLSGREYKGRILKPDRRQAVLFKRNIYPAFDRSFSRPALLLGLAAVFSLVFFRLYRICFLLLPPLLINLIFGLIALDPVEGFLAHFYLPSLFMTAILIGISSRYFLDLLCVLTTSNMYHRRFLYLLLLITLVMLFVLRPARLPNRRLDFLAYDFAANQMKCLLPDAVLIAVGTRMTFPLKYLLYTQNQREDVLMIEGGFLKPIYAGWYPDTLNLPPETLNKNLNGALAHQELVNYFAPTRSLYFAPLYASGYSPLKTVRLPNNATLFNYRLGAWLLPTNQIQNAAGFLKSIAARNVTLRSYIQKQYRPTPYEGYIFRKYNQFLRTVQG